MADNGLQEIGKRKGTITLVEGTSKKTGKTFRALKLDAGQWSDLYFPSSRFEMDYVSDHLSIQPKEEDFFKDIQ